ncbi:GIY-YIG nuclease family protein [Micromonospora chalcea]|uniref:GIY-YIG nuclease family protein n=1 Tax=Micromonospora chalcea TaxID=1874 RepID=UPI0021A5F207|nr:GIY-YIG nuclease family protein [Micromonospora chalcea]MCT2280704.1 GIY-YIG nuclease family protein [Micromonospora chalcea]
MAKIPKKDQPPRAVRLIRAELAKVMALDDPNDPGCRIGDAVGVYAYFDYDDEPIYVGQTSSSFRDRVSRHLTGQRSDAVAKFILDPFEVASVSMWSLPHVYQAESLKKPGQKAGPAEKKALLNPYEYTVYKTLEERSKFHAVLNEGVIHPTELVELPPAVHAQIIPAALWEDRKHSDVRIARRAATISRLSQMISEREVSGGMRRTLLLQARRLTWLAQQRIHEVGVELPDAEDEAIGDE